LQTTVDIFGCRSALAITL